jgi:hypothetical protein
MADPKSYAVAFDSTDNADIDSETTLLKDSPQTLDAILATCRKHGVRARVSEGDQLLAEIVPANERRVRTAK